MFCKIILLQFTDCALPEWQRTELWPLRPKASGPSPPAVPNAAQNKMKRRRDQTKWEKTSFFLNCHYIQSAGFYRITSFLVERHCPSQLRFSYQPSFILKVIIMVLGKNDRKDWICTVHNFILGLPCLQWQSYYLGDVIWMLSKIGFWFGMGKMCTTIRKASEQEWRWCEKVNEKIVQPIWVLSSAFGWGLLGKV